MAGDAVIFEKLILQGFGPYRDTTTFTFTEGINSYIAANETGKTSMMAGLLATIFGLSHRRRAGDAFNLDRFRNWDQPAACRGELFLSSAGQRYQLQRDFDTHHVALWELPDGQGQHRLVVEGQHNPEARKPLRSYEEAVHRLLGISSQELFEATFFVAQPLPEVSQISADLQGLLSGGQGASFQAALAALLAKLKNLTKYTGPSKLGVTGRNMSKDGMLERLAEEIQMLQEQIAAGQQSADSLIEAQLQVRTVEEELGQARRDLEQQNSARQAWSGWQLLASQYVAAAKERANLESAILAVHKLTDALAELEKTLQEQYPEFAQTGPELSEELEKLVYLSHEIGQAAAAAGELQNCRQQQLEQQAGLASALAKFPHWEQLGADPVASIRAAQRSAAACLKSWQAFQSDRQKLDTVQRPLDGCYGLFGTASAGELAALSQLNPTQAALAAEAEQAGQAYGSAEQKFKAWEAARREHQTKFGDLLELPDGAEEAAAAKYQLLKKQRELDQQLRELGASPEVPLGARLAVGAALAGVAFFLLGTGNQVLLVAGLVLAFLLGAAGLGLFYRPTNAAARSRRLAVQRELARLQEQLPAYDRQLGSYARADDLELARLVERLKQYAEEERRLKAIQQELAGLDLAGLKKRWQDKQAALASFQRATQAFTNTYDDVPAAYHEWQELVREQQRLTTATKQFAQATFGCPSAAAEAVKLNSSTLDGQWRELAAALPAILGEEPTERIKNIGALVSRLADLTDTWWLAREAEAAQLVTLRKEQETLQHQLATTEKLIEAEQGKLTRLQQKQQPLEKSLRPVLQANANSPKQALERYKKRRQQVRLKEDAQTKLAMLLHNYQAADLDQLLAKYRLAGDQVAGRMLQWQQHSDRFPGLPAPDQADDQSLVQQKLRETEATLQTLGDRIAALDSQRSELYRQLARLEGVNPVDIAVAEVDLQELKAEQELLELQADALALAYQELGSAVTEYQQTYQQRLEEQATAYCRGISGVPDRQLVLDEQLCLGIREGGRPVPLESLSKGARDQVYLALRLAVADLLAEEIKLPLIFDDPFTSTDAVRLARIQEMLASQAEERQFFILAHADHYAGWGQTIGISQA